MGVVGWLLQHLGFDFAASNFCCVLPRLNPLRGFARVFVWPWLFSLFAYTKNNNAGTSYLLFRIHFCGKVRSLNNITPHEMATFEH